MLKRLGKIVSNLSKRNGFVKRHYNMESTMEGAYELFQRKQYNEALNILNKYLDVETDSLNRAALLNNIALVYEETNQLDKAIREYSKSLQLNPDEPSTYTNLAVIYHKQEKYDDAIALYLKTLAMDPHDIDCLYKLSQAYTATYKMKESIESLRKIIEIEPNYLNAYADLAVHLRESDESMQIAEKFILLEGESGTRGLRLKSWILSTQKKYLEALEVYEEIIEKEPNDATAYMDSALILSELKRYNDAIALAHRAFEIQPTNREVLHTLAVVLEQMGRTDEAIHIFEKLVKLYPGNEHVLLFFGQLLQKLGRKKEIFPYIAEATEKYPAKEADYQILMDHFRKD